MPLTAQQASALAKLELSHSPVAVAFVSSPPDGLSRIDTVQPAGCSYWKLASEGHAFFTTPDDHGHCPVGAFTHGVELAPRQSDELQALVGTMVELKYLKAEEIPQIPRRREPMEVAAYAPLERTPFAPDAVVFRGNARQVMLLWEAARAAGTLETGTVMGRPACAMLPLALQARGGVASVGCIGNRVYTGLGDGELYITVPGQEIGAVLDQLETMLDANARLAEFHGQRLATLGGAS